MGCLDTNNILCVLQTALDGVREKLSSDPKGLGLLEIDESFSRLTKFGGDYDYSLKELNRLQSLLTKESLNYYADEISKESDLHVIETVRELFDLWIDSADKVNANAIASSSYSKTYAALILAGCRFKRELDKLQRLTMNSMSEDILREVNEKVRSVAV